MSLLPGVDPTLLASLLSSGVVGVGASELRHWWVRRKGARLAERKALVAEREQTSEAEQRLRSDMAEQIDRLTRRVEKLEAQIEELRQRNVALVAHNLALQGEVREHKLEIIRLRERPKRAGRRGTDPIVEPSVDDEKAG